MELWDLYDRDRKPLDKTMVRGVYLRNGRAAQGLFVKRLKYLAYRAAIRTFDYRRNLRIGHGRDAAAQTRKRLAIFFGQYVRPHR